MALCNLIMRSISSAVEDEYNCISNLIPTNPDKLVEILSKIEKKIKDDFGVVLEREVRLVGRFDDWK